MPLHGSVLNFILFSSPALPLMSQLPPRFVLTVIRQLDSGFVKKSVTSSTSSRDNATDPTNPQTK